MNPDSLPSIGMQHPRVRQVRQVAANLGASRQRLFVAEGLWAHSVLLDLGARIEAFLWCPESGRSEQARAVAAGIAQRASDAFRADGLIVTNRRTRLAHPKVFRGSRGMNLRVPILEFAAPAGAQEWLRCNGFATFLATVSADAKPYHEVRFGARVAIVVGNERLGICPGWLELGLPQVIIPMHGRADSLNVAVSASVLLYAVRAHLTSPLGQGAGSAKAPIPARSDY